MKFEAVRFDFADQIEQAEQEAEATRKAGEDNYWGEEVPCEHCGEVMRRALMATNHNIVFNGWCSKRFFINNRCIDRQTREAVDTIFATWKPKDRDWLWKLAQEDMAWLAEHGFPIVDPWSDVE